MVRAGGAAVTRQKVTAAWGAGLALEQDKKEGENLTILALLLVSKKEAQRPVQFWFKLLCYSAAIANRAGLVPITRSKPVGWQAGPQPPCWLAAQAILREGSGCLAGPGCRSARDFLAL